MSDLFLLEHSPFYYSRRVSPAPWLKSFLQCKGGVRADSMSLLIVAAGAARSGRDSRTWSVLGPWNEGPSRDRAWWHLDGWGLVRPRHKEGKWGEGPSLAITAMFFFKEFTNVFWLSVSIRKVDSKYPFCVLICINSYIFHIHFILFIFLSNTYLIFNVNIIVIIQVKSG